MRKPSYWKLIGLSTACAACLLTTTGLGAAEPANQLSQAERKAGWKLLFDGTSTKGWRNYKKDSIGDGWKVVDGELTRAAKGAGDIVTAKQYGQFELQLQYKISKGGNSGLMYHVTEDQPAPWHTGPEIQIQDNVDGHDPQKAGWLYQLYPSKVDATRPAGEWNQMHIRISRDGCETYMNGLRYNQYKKGGADWDKKVAASKFSKFPKFGKPTSGYICLQDHGNLVSFRNIKIRELGGETTNPVDGPLPVTANVAFKQLQWTGWSNLDERGRVQRIRPIVLTHAGDGSNKIYVATQRGVVHAFDNDESVKATSIYLNIQDRVVYKDRQNEEGLLGFAFHPDYRKTGEVYVYYTTKEAPQTSVISRFRRSKDDPSKADPSSEEEIMRIKQPYWNHNGGTIAFGPDGYLYIGLGDGGAANDPLGNGQNLGTLLGSILRIDINKKDAGLGYAIPTDNPFVKRQGARPEIWAYGLRNVWRLAFDGPTKMLWAGDVGQNLWEEINVIEKGGNYGWNLREASQVFGRQVAGDRDDLIAPVWEYDHGIGKSITGGVVYRGPIKQLQGHYIYADYVSGKLWALKYDSASGKVVGNYAIDAPKLEVISFGEDAKGEVYALIVAPDGRGIYRLEKK